MSAGCTNCYAIEMARRLEAMRVEKSRDLTRKSGKRTVWKASYARIRLLLKFHFDGNDPKKIFVNSMSDLFQDFSQQVIYCGCLVCNGTDTAPPLPDTHQTT